MSNRTHQIINLTPSYICLRSLPDVAPSSDIYTSSTSPLAVQWTFDYNTPIACRLSCCGCHYLINVDDTASAAKWHLVCMLSHCGHATGAFLDSKASWMFGSDSVYNRRTWIHKRRFVENMLTFNHTRFIRLNNIWSRDTIASGS